MANINEHIYDNEKF